jgi:Ran GTPase-activating protein (RanGAP) involved in mRNA processing and transport
MTIEEILYALKQNITSTLYGYDLFCSPQRIDDAGMELLSNALRENTSCKVLDLSGTHVTTQEAKTLAAAIKANPVLESIDLYGSTIFARGMTALAEALLENTSLTSINFGRNPIKSEGSLALLKKIAALNAVVAISMNCTYDTLHNQALVNAMQANTSLKHVLLQSFNSTSGLLSLAQAWRATSSLTCLDLSKLQDIEPSGYYALVETLSTLPSFTALNLSQAKISGAGAEALALLLKTSPSLSWLNLGHALNNAGPQKYKIIEALQSSQALSSINLDENNLDSSGALLLAKALDVNEKLTSVSFKKNVITPLGSEALASALKANSTLTRLNLEKTYLGTVGVTHLARALRVNNTLTFINLSANKIRSPGAEALASALAVNTSLITINLSANKIGQAGAQAFAESLLVNTTLCHLSLARNTTIGEAMAATLTTALMKNNTLTLIDLTEIAPDDPLAQATATLLRVNSTLSSISLPIRSPFSDSYVEERSVEQLTEAMRSNTSILDFDSCYKRWRMPELSREYGTTLCQLLERNRRRSLFITSPHGLKNTILYSLFNKPLFSNPPCGETLPPIVKFQLTQCATALMLLNSAILDRAIMSGWCNNKECAWENQHTPANDRAHHFWQVLL